MKEHINTFFSFILGDATQYTIIGIIVFFITLICMSFYAEWENKRGGYNKTTLSDYFIEIVISITLGALWPIIVFVVVIIAIAFVPIWIGKRIFFVKDKIENKKEK